MRDETVKMDGAGNQLADSAEQGPAFVFSAAGARPTASPTGADPQGPASAFPNDTTHNPSVPPQRLQDSKGTSPFEPSSLRGERIAVVLSPGGLPGIEAHVGAWWAMEAAGIVPAGLSGASAGAVVGSLWATGMTAIAAVGLLGNLEADDLVVRRPLRWLRIRHIDSLYDPTPIADLLSAYLPDSFDGFALPLRISTTHLPTGNAVHWATNGWIDAAAVPAVLASMSIPGFWPPVEIGGSRYADGALSDGLVMPCGGLGNYDRVIVIRCIDRDREEHLDNVVGLARWGLGCLLRRESEQDRADWLESAAATEIEWIDIDTTAYGCLAFSPQFELLYAAYKTVAEALRDTGIGQAGLPTEHTEDTDGRGTGGSV